MDYVEWCDNLANAIAEYADKHDRWVNLQQFAAEFSASLGTSDNSSASHDVILDAAEVLGVCGVDVRSPFLQLTHADVQRLTDYYDRWLYSHSIPLDDLSLMLLDALNRLSQRLHQDYATVDEVNLDLIVAEVGQGPDGVTIDADLATEVLDRLVARGLARSHKTIGLFRYKSSYLGVARTNRAHIAQDQEIDQIRTAGEGDTLDYKRSYQLDTNAQKWELVKDVTALANAGGPGARCLLLGIEDNGEFYRPPSPEKDALHRKLLRDAAETRLQQIVTSRTTHSPSVRVLARGEHREGPYVLIEITTDVHHLPYRIYQNQTDRTSSDAHEIGEVWIRKGTTKALATPAEIATLERQAALFNRTRSAI